LPIENPIDALLSFAAIMNKERFKVSLRQYFLTNRSWTNRYLVSMVLLVVASLLVYALAQVENARVSSIILVASVFAAIHGGLGPAVLTSILGSLILDFFFIEPIFRVLDSVNSFVRIFFFNITAVSVSVLVATMREVFIESEKFKRAAVKATEEKDAFIATVSHDLRNPLGVILGFADMLKGRTADREGLELIAIIENNCEYSLNLIKDLQELSALGHKDFKPVWKQVDVFELVRYLCTSASIVAEQKGIGIVNPLKADQTCLCVADEQLLRRAVQNLIDNAIKYSSPGASICVSIYQKQECVEIVIKDAGLGIPESEQTKIFLPFYRTLNKPTGGESSTGLGLATVAAIAEVHGGKVSVASSAGNGSTFSLMIPKMRHQLFQINLEPLELNR
jgi:signal transduction histidine kinase